MNTDINEYINTALRLLGKRDMDIHYQACEIARLEEQNKALLDRIAREFPPVPAPEKPDA